MCRRRKIEIIIGEDVETFGQVMKIVDRNPKVKFDLFFMPDKSKEPLPYIYTEDDIRKVLKKK